MDPQTNNTIVIRDRRQKHQFSIHNRLIDEWFGILGQTGFALYCLYCRMADARSESSYPGYSYIQALLGVSRRTIADYNKLLSWCALVHVDPGEAGRHNVYYVLDVPQLTPALLDRIRCCAQAEMDTSADARFNRMIVGRVDGWAPIAACRRKRAGVARPASLSDTPHPPPGVPRTPGSSPSVPPRVSPPPSGIHGIPDGAARTPDGVPGTRPGVARASHSVSGTHPGAVRTLDSAARTPDGVARTPDGAARTPDQSRSTILTNNPHQQSSSTAGPDEDALALVNDLIELIDGLKKEQALQLVAEHGVAACRHLMALTLDHARENPAGYLLRCASSPARLPYSEAEIARTIRRHRALRVEMSHHDLSGGQKGGGAGGGDGGEPDAGPLDRKCAALWQVALAELSMTNSGVAQALAGSRLEAIGGDGTAVVRVRHRHVAENERLRVLIARTLIPIAKDRGCEVCEVRLGVI